MLSAPNAIALAQAPPGDRLNYFPTLPDRTGNAGAPAGSDGKVGAARLRMLRSGFRYFGTRLEIDPLLLLGEHTNAILAELGYDAARIAARRETKEVG